MKKLIQKGNKQLLVDDARAAALITTAGYVEIDQKTGKPIKGEDPEKDLKKENAALKKENKELRELADDLKAKLEAAQRSQ